MGTKLALKASWLCAENLGNMSVMAMAVICMAAAHLLVMLIKAASPGSLYWPTASLADR